MTIVIWVFIATLLGHETPQAFSFGTMLQCVQMSNVLLAAGHETTGCAALSVTLTVANGDKGGK